MFFANYLCFRPREDRPTIVLMKVRDGGGTLVARGSRPLPFQARSTSC